MMDARAHNALRIDDTRRTLAVIDRDYASVGCLGVGGFGSVFLARKRGSGRKVALKVMPMDTSDDEEYERFTRELESVVELNDCADKGQRDLNIVYFEDWFISGSFVCIVMQYADGGTLAQEIERKSTATAVVPYTERRVAWYALQLCDALAFAHERGVAHNDVKAANVLIDASAGGKLLLADFGTALKPGEETVGFTKSYASLELIASHELEDYAHLRPDKIDSFALGAVIYELLTLKKLEELSADMTLAEHITDGPGLEAALNSNVMLPWLPPNSSGSGVVGYTHELKNLVMNFLKPNANERLLPGQLQNAFRHDPLSPLLLAKVTAANPATPGDVISIDNVQLGMLCQRGPDWADGDDDGGKGSIGVVVKLDGDGTYVDVAFPSRTGKQIESICCRIGAGNKYELQVGPSPLPDFVTGSSTPRLDGAVSVGKGDSVRVGQMVNPNCMVVGVDGSLGIAFVAPMERHSHTLARLPSVWQTENADFVSPQEEAILPETWQPSNFGSCIDVLDSDEREDVLELLYNKSGGLKESECPVLSIQRVQDKFSFDNYARGIAKVANENWGLDNEVRAFAVADEELNTSNIQSFSSGGRQFSTKASVIHNKHQKQSATKSQLILCRVALGRMHDGADTSQDWLKSSSSLICHSEKIGKDVFACRGANLAYPEYLITYRHPKKKVEAQSVGDADEDTGRSASKMCIICMERAVRYLCVPCGHPCLCEKCNTSNIRAKLKGRCPECRARFKSTVIVYGRVVNDE
ncbi:hypothetical protein ACHAXT_003396 [Thalassiosira profunda]